MADDVNEEEESVAENSIGGVAEEEVRCIKKVMQVRERSFEAEFSFVGHLIITRPSKMEEYHCDIRNITGHN